MRVTRLKEDVLKEAVNLSSRSIRAPGSRSRLANLSMYSRCAGA